MPRFRSRPANVFPHGIKCSCKTWTRQTRSFPKLRRASSQIWHRSDETFRVAWKLFCGAVHRVRLRVYSFV